MSEAAKMPTGPVQGARFGGLLEGGVGDRLALERAVLKLREEGPVTPTLEVEADRFCLYLDDATVPPQQADAQRMQAFLTGLNDIVAAAKDGKPIASSLRCTELYPEEVVETHFGLDAGEVTAVSRVRPRLAADAPEEEALGEAQASQDSAPRRVLIAICSMLLLGVFLWQGRVVDRVWGAPVEELEASTGPFGEMLEVQLEKGFGAYRVLLTRGDGYPLNGAAVSRLEDSAGSPLERAAVTVVADGTLLEAMVLDDEGKILARTSVSTSALLVGAEETIELVLPARIGASVVHLAVFLPKLPTGDAR